ncbi:thioredoxin family protein [Aquisalimonas sp. 2447]|uniref:thioredoxin family protein n=1 Tax=Aquisalimonas sp. 2447 TaxID=2740807 RepID=UPI0014324F48|nr:thioredoxin family protein [Aquisalimonas sp. 2447]QIT55956.1 thioredoxin family protein [Aquisalimonas sp. 2447]
MVATASRMMPLETPLPRFRLLDTDGNIVASDDFVDADALLVVFMCNHCPFVRHIAQGLASFAREFMPRGLAVVGINSNDAERFPDDSFEAMGWEKARVGYPFPYLHDPDQTVAHAFGAACTPDFFLFDGDGSLAYRGQFDGSRPGNNTPVTGDDLRAAATAVLTGTEVDPDQTPSMGCNIKWKPGNEPA